MKYTILFFLLLWIGKSVESQNLNDKLLVSFLNDNDFSKFVIPSFHHDCDTVYIIDTAHVFNESSYVSFKKPVIILHRYIKNPPLREWYCHNLILTVKHRSGNTYEIQYFHEPSNSVGFFRYKSKKGKLIKIKQITGVY